MRSDRVSASFHRDKASSRRVDWLKVRYPERVKFHGYFDTLIAAGYDPLLLDAWLDGLSDGTVVVGMPGDLVLSFFGEPTYRKEVIYEGAPAFEWGVKLLPGRVEITVAGNKVVRVRGQIRRRLKPASCREKRAKAGSIHGALPLPPPRCD